MRQLVVLDLVTDLSIGLACAAIAFALIHFARRPTGLPYARVFVAFAVFIIADGATHLAAVWSVWQPSAWLATLLKVATALASVAVALVLPPLVPKALGLSAASAMLDGAPDAILLVDGTGVIRLVNERAERLFGYARSQLLGRPSTLVLPDDVRAARDVQRDVYGLRRDGSRFLAEISVSPLVTDGGRLITAVVRDVTDRRRLEDDRVDRGRAEVARAHAEEIGRRASFLAEASRVLAASLDYEATLRSVARVAIPYLADYVLVDVLETQGRLRRLAAAHRDPVLEERLASAPGQAPVTSGTSALEAVIERGEPTLVRDVSDDWLAARARDAEHLGAAAGARPTSLMLVPLRARGRTLGVVSFVLVNGARRYALADLALAEDLAQRAALAADNARLYREAQDASRAKDEFLAVLSHELRTPLTPVLGWVRMLRTGTLAPEATERALDTVERNTRLQAQLVEDLLDVSRIIAGKLSLNLRPVALGPIVDMVIEGAAASTLAKSIIVTRQVEPDLPRIEADANRLQQVVANLLSNAVKFTPAGGRVEVGVARAGDDLRLTVADTGDGLAPEIAPHIFDRFRQADSTITRQYGGLGLGLSIVRHIVERHGGTVQATSEGPGHGTTFTVTLPIGGPLSDAPIGAARTPSPAAEDSLAGVRVLVVDDEPDTREMVTEILKAAGAEVLAAGSTDEALRRADEGAPDVLVSDLAMPARDGYALLRALHGRGMAGGLVTIALTAHARREDRERALGAGYDAYVTKPVEPAALAALVKELVEKRRRRA
ncbi:MAG: histidine kinase [Candidatus Rokuibacteriota bacterium]|nr:MAG: histidine kinase [Candidatus Rokubacteria bacterium]